MKSLKVPSLFKFVTAAEFIKTLMALNADRRGFSQRSFSTRLKWPTSYIPDLMKGRKKFTIERAVQLARYLELDSIDMEKLILLAVTDLGYTSAAESTRLRENKSPKVHAATADLELLDAHLFLVFELIRWFKGHGKFADIVFLAARQGLNEDNVHGALRILVRKKLVSIKNKSYTAKDVALMSDDWAIDDLKIHTQFSHFFQKHLQDRVGPAMYNASIVHLERGRYDEVAEKILALRNWVHELSTKDAALPGSQDVRLFQLDLNLTPLISKPTALSLQGRRRGEDK